MLAAVGVGDDGAIAACEGATEELADGGALAGAGGAEELEVFGFVRGRDRLVGEGQAGLVGGGWMSDRRGAS